jgi:hypothetical protein
VTRHVIVSDPMRDGHCVRRCAIEAKVVGEMPSQIARFADAQDSPPAP